MQGDDEVQGISSKVDDDIIDAEIISEEEARENIVIDGKAETVGADGMPKKTAGWVTKLGWSLVFLLVAFIGGLFAEPLVEPVLNRLGLMETRTGTVDEAEKSPQLTAQLENQSAQITALNQTVQSQQEQLSSARQLVEQTRQDMAALASKLSLGPAAGDNQNPEAITALRNEIASLRAEIASKEDGDNREEIQALSGHLTLARNEAKILRDRLSTLEATVAAQAMGDLEQNPRGRLALSLGRLSRLMEAGQAYGELLAGFRLDLTALPALDQQSAGAALDILTQHQRGVASHSDLVSAYPNLVRGVKQADAGGGVSGWWATLFVSRNTGVSGEGIDGVLNDAERQLQGRNLGAALNFLDQLEPNLQAAAKPWMDRAIARRDALGAVNILANLSVGASTVKEPNAQTEPAPVSEDASSAEEDAATEEVSP